jgi:glycosyltransferase 2 family protein
MLKNKRVLALIIGSVMGILMVFFWLRYIDIADLTLKLKNMDKSYVIWAALIYLSAYFIRSWRWNILLKRTANVSILQTWLYSMGGNWINYLIPIRLGEIVKAWFVKRNHKAQIVNVLPSIFIDKSFDTLGIFFVLLMIPLLRIKLSTGLSVLLILLGLVFLVSILVLFLSAKRKLGVTKALQFFVAWLPRRWRDKVFGYIEMFVQGLNVFEHHWTRLVLAFLLTALGVFLDGLYFWLIFKAFAVPTPFTVVLFGYTLINLSYALPQPPAQLGSNEWMMIIIFSLGFTLTKLDAAAIMAFAHVLTAILIGLTGVIAILLSGRQIITKIFNGDKIYE